jgi:tRNA modification GTPase
MVAFETEDTITAIASAPGPGIRGIVRISGPQATHCVDSLFHSADGKRLTDYRTTTAVAGNLKLSSGLSLPGELLLWPTRQSYTRQPTAEFHTVGSTPVLQMVLSELCQAGARLAKPGEFTLRAFLSGRIDLTQAEAVLAVIDSTGEQQLSTALQQLAGGLAGPLGEVRDQLLGTLAELEAGLDFVEEDIEFISPTELTHQLEIALKQIRSIADQVSTRDLVADAVKVVLIGMPNSGKSSLFNALTGSQHAIVTDVAGTTTDFISAKLDLEPVSIELIDTAGFENTSEQIGNQAQTHRAAQGDQAQVRLLCLDMTCELNQWEIDQLIHADRSTIVVLTKSDLTSANTTGAAIERSQLINSSQFSGPVIVTSTVNRTGLDELRDQISIEVLESQNTEQTVVSTTVLRASESLHEAMKSVEHALHATRQQLGEEVVAAEIRQALEGLGQVVGTVYTDDILDLVFGRFCIGK